MLSIITAPLKASTDPRDQAVGMMLEQQSKTSKEVTYQSAVLHDLTRDMGEQKRQSQDNGQRIASIEGFNIAAVVTENAKNTAWRTKRETRWRRIAYAAGVVASIVIAPAAIEVVKSVAHHLFP